MKDANTAALDAHQARLDRNEAEYQQRPVADWYDIMNIAAASKHIKSEGSILDEPFCGIVDAVKANIRRGELHLEGLAFGAILKIAELTPIEDIDDFPYDDLLDIANNIEADHGEIGRLVCKSYPGDADELAIGKMVADEIKRSLIEIHRDRIEDNGYRIPNEY